MPESLGASTVGPGPEHRRKVTALDMGMALILLPFVVLFGAFPICSQVEAPFASVPLPDRLYVFGSGFVIWMAASVGRLAIVATNVAGGLTPGWWRAWKSREGRVELALTLAVPASLLWAPAAASGIFGIQGLAFALVWTPIAWWAGGVHGPKQALGYGLFVAWSVWLTWIGMFLGGLACLGKS